MSLLGCFTTLYDLQILEGSPWLQSRPVFVLATQQRNSEQGLTYTLRVRVSKPEAESEISRVSHPKKSLNPVCVRDPSPRRPQALQRYCVGVELRLWRCRFWARSGQMAVPSCLYRSCGMAS